MQLDSSKSLLASCQSALPALLGGDFMPARNQAADQHAANPFTARSGSPTFPYCMWEVLIDHPEGLSVTAIVEQLKQRGLRDVSGLKSPCGQVGAYVARF